MIPTASLGVATISILMRNSHFGDGYSGSGAKRALARRIQQCVCVRKYGGGHGDPWAACTRRFGSGTREMLRR